MKYSLRYMTNRILFLFSTILKLIARILESAAPGIKRGIYLVKSDHFGYTVQVDEVTLDFDLSYSEANKLCDILRHVREKT